MTMVKNTGGYSFDGLKSAFSSEAAFRQGDPPPKMSPDSLWIRTQ
jgi:hypothetical protein